MAGGAPGTHGYYEALNHKRRKRLGRLSQVESLGNVVKGIASLAGAWGTAAATAGTEAAYQSALEGMSGAAPVGGGDSRFLHGFQGAPGGGGSPANYSQALRSSRVFDDIAQDPAAGTGVAGRAQAFADQSRQDHYSRNSMVPELRRPSRGGMDRAGMDFAALSRDYKPPGFLKTYLGIPGTGIRPSDAFRMQADNMPPAMHPLEEEKLRAQIADIHRGDPAGDYLKQLQLMERERGLQQEAHDFALDKYDARLKATGPKHWRQMSDEVMGKIPEEFHDELRIRAGEAEAEWAEGVRGQLKPVKERQTGIWRDLRILLRDPNVDFDMLMLKDDPTYAEQIQRVEQGNLSRDEFKEGLARRYDAHVREELDAWRPEGVSPQESNTYLAARHYEINPTAENWKQLTDLVGGLDDRYWNHDVARLGTLAEHDESMRIPMARALENTLEGGLIGLPRMSPEERAAFLMNPYEAAYGGAAGPAPEGSWDPAEEAVEAPAEVPDPNLEQLRAVPGVGAGTPGTPGTPGSPAAPQAQDLPHSGSLKNLRELEAFREKAVSDLAAWERDVPPRMREALLRYWNSMKRRPGTSGTPMTPEERERLYEDSRRQGPLAPFPNQGRRPPTAGHDTPY